MGFNAKEDRRQSLDQSSKTSGTAAAARFQQWFADNGGYETMGTVVLQAQENWDNKRPARNPNLVLKVLQLLEVLTCHRDQEGPKIGGGTTNANGTRRISVNVLDVLVSALQTASTDRQSGCSAVGGGASGPMITRMLHIIINLCAHGVCHAGTSKVKPMLHACWATLVHECDAPDPDTDIINCCLCLLINVTETRADMRQVVSELRLDEVKIIPFLVQSFEEQAAKETTGGNIVASYMAQLLGCLTISHEMNRRLVRQELGKYADHTVDPGDPNHGNPMVRLVAVLQEFLLFQSEAGVLTHATLVGLHHVLTHLMKENHISLPESEPKDFQAPVSPRV
jgi:hypothetical protein